MIPILVTLKDLFLYKNVEYKIFLFPLWICICFIVLAHVSECNLVFNTGRKLFNIAAPSLCATGALPHFWTLTLLEVDE
jgi:hypothetical protein